MQQPGAVDRRQGAAQVDPDHRDLALAQDAAAGEVLLERATAQQVGPQSQAAVVLVGAMDDQHVRVPHARQPPCLLEQASAHRRIDGLGEQLERHLALQHRVVGPIDLAERSPSDALDEPQRAPGACRGGIGPGGGRQRAAHGLDQPEPVQHLRQLGTRAALEVPVDRAAIGDRLREAHQDALHLVAQCAPRSSSMAAASRTIARAISMRAALGDWRPRLRATSSYEKPSSTLSTIASRCGGASFASAAS